MSTANTPAPAPRKPTRPVDRIATALETIGLRLTIPDAPITDVADLAARVEVAARNFVAGRRQASAARDDDDFALDPNPAPEPWYGP